MLKQRLSPAGFPSTAHTSSPHRSSARGSSSRVITLPGGQGLQGLVLVSHTTALQPLSLAPPMAGTQAREYLSTRQGRSFWLPLPPFRAESAGSARAPGGLRDAGGFLHTHQVVDTCVLAPSCWRGGCGAPLHAAEFRGRAPDRAQRPPDRAQRPLLPFWNPSACSPFCSFSPTEPCSDLAELRCVRARPQSVTSVCGPIAARCTDV